MSVHWDRVRQPTTSFKPWGKSWTTCWLGWNYCERICGVSPWVLFSVYSLSLSTEIMSGGVSPWVPFRVYSLSLSAGIMSGNSQHHSKRGVIPWLPHRLGCNCCKRMWGGIKFFYVFCLCLSLRSCAAIHDIIQCHTQHDTGLPPLLPNAQSLPVAMKPVATAVNTLPCTTAMPPKQRISESGIPGMWN